MVKFDALGDRWRINGGVEGMSDGLVRLCVTFLDNVPESIRMPCSLHDDFSLMKYVERCFVK